MTDRRPLLQAFLTQCTERQNTTFLGVYGAVADINDDIIEDAIAYVQEMIDENMESWQIMSRPNRKTK